MLAQELLDILACPACKGGINPIEEGQYLLCRQCRLKYPVRNGIPVMLENEAETVPERLAADEIP